MPSVVTTKDYDHLPGGGVPPTRLFATHVPAGSVFDAELEDGYYVGDWGSMNGTYYIEVPAEICEPYSEQRMKRAMSQLLKKEAMQDAETLKAEHRKLQQKLDALAWIDQGAGPQGHTMYCASEDLTGHPAPCTCGADERNRIPNYLRQLVLKS